MDTSSLPKILINWLFCHSKHSLTGGRDRGEGWSSDKSSQKKENPPPPSWEIETKAKAWLQIKVLNKENQRLVSDWLSVFSLYYMGCLVNLGRPNSNMLCTQDCNTLVHMLSNIPTLTLPLPHELSSRDAHSEPDNDHLHVFYAFAFVSTFSKRVHT
jgi:hypothetical protein